ncbi:hypothetical protein KY345_05635 [Candidatus Woesearchaeota archaeon]|nr:hypothetical protein [Candidatus Woesearchaeota archaeon]
MKAVIYLLMFIILISSVSAGHMKLLAVSQVGERLIGNEADLFLEIKKGSGRVFIETFPITKMDTQISTRFAKEIACSYLERDCNEYDFFYTIKGESGIIGGPSAGAAISVLTIAELESLGIDENVSMTGTINSGGIIGPVGGVKEKIEAAKKAGLSKVLVPVGERIDDNETNVSLEEFAKRNEIIVVEVSTIDEAVYEFTGWKREEEEISLEIDEEYSSTMRQLAEMLCDKTVRLQSELMEGEFLQNMNESLKESEDIAINLTIKGKKAFEGERYYSSASYCFGANLKYRYLLLKKENLSESELIERMNKLQDEISNFEQEIDGKEKKTITDLETYMIVKERIKEAKEGFNRLRESLRDDAESELAYVIERFYSAGTWAEFFGKKGREYDFSKEKLKRSCQDKLAEAEERYQYLRFFIPDLLLGLRKEIDFAYDDYEKGEYDLCLFKASKAKAEANVIVGGIGVGEDDLRNLNEKKIEIVGRNLAKQANKGIFPIVGYSYYEYAKSMKDDDLYSAMLYLEYALELGNLDIYFQEEDEEAVIIEIDGERLGLFIVGVVTGLIVGIFIGAKASKQKTPRRTSRRSFPGKKR